ncbi:MAG: cytochrome c-type biogenesis protein CcmH [Alphaproteobacteria bacterium]|nr:cytochrome c-type biogenesis protein CcmH [Alphaproteobacteria bacterium]
MKIRRFFLLFLLGIAVATAFADTARAVLPDEMLSNPVLERRARKISEGLRCLVCQNESIDDSDAALAHDLRILVRKRLLAGDTDAQVKQYIVSRYGNYVLLKPPFDAETLGLWLGPGALLLFGAAAAVFFYRRKDGVAETPRLSGEERARLDALMNGGQGGGENAS